MLDTADAGTIGMRDRPLTLLGSELVGLDVGDCAFSREGLTVTLRRSKTDQDGAGRKIGIPYGSNPRRVRSALFRRGSNRPRYRRVRYSALSTGVDKSSRIG
jgi:hypothetical protein